MILSLSLSLSLSLFNDMLVDIINKAYSFIQDQSHQQHHQAQTEYDNTKANYMSNMQGDTEKW